MGGTANLERALAIFTRLRTRAAGGRENTPCDDKEIELALASLAIERGSWPAFDELRLEARHFPGFEPHLCLSVRFLRELLETTRMPCAQARLRGKAMRSAVLAMEESGFTNASCVSQLAHCIRLLSCWPDVLLHNRGIQAKDVRKFAAAAKFLFGLANQTVPFRQRMEKDQRWRARERALLALLSSPQVRLFALTH